MIVSAFDMAASNDRDVPPGQIFKAAYGGKTGLFMKLLYPNSGNRLWLLQFDNEKGPTFISTESFGIAPCVALPNAEMRIDAIGEYTSPTKDTIGSALICEEGIVLHVASFANNQPEGHFVIPSAGERLQIAPKHGLVCDAWSIYPSGLGESVEPIFQRRPPI